MRQTIETAIREAAQSIADTYRLPSHIIEEELIHSIMPHVEKMRCPHVVQPDPNDNTQYCRFAEGVARRLQSLEACLQSAEKMCLHVIPPSLSSGHKWLSLYRVPVGNGYEWKTYEYATFAGLILALPTE
jgi:hypothetical protein